MELLGIAAMIYVLAPVAVFLLFFIAWLVLTVFSRR
jgi:hypothetical protein